MISVVKIGGNVIDDPVALRSFLKDFAALRGDKILVHGGGKEATRLSASMGVETKMIDGRRITDRATLDIVTMVYAGLVNKRIVAALQAIGCDAVGLTGADGNAVPAVRRNPEPIDFGYVGDIDPTTVDVGFITSLLDAGKTPVFCAICHDGAGTLLNCNADSVASAVAVAMALLWTTVRLIYCFEKAGVLYDVEDPESVIPVLTPGLFDRLCAEGRVNKGMIPKLGNAIEAVKMGVSETLITSATDLDAAAGTKIRIAE